MWDRNKKFFHGLLNVFVAFSFAFSAFSCGGGANDQLGGIVGEVRFNTQACVPQQKIVQIRNDDTVNPQRVMGVYFELGTNADNNFKIDKVLVGSTEYTPASNLAEEILIPAGGIMSIHTTYKPRRVTTHTNDVTYLDLFLNGPKLGILQIKMNGEAPTAQAGCGLGETRNFKVNKIDIIVKAAALPGGQFTNTITEDTITKPFKFTVTNEVATMETDDFTAFSITADAIPTPDHRIGVGLSEPVEGSFTSTGSLAFEEFIIAVGGGALMAPGELTTGTSSTGDVSLTGSPFDSTTKQMKLVFTGTITRSAAAELTNGTVGATFELVEQTE